MNRNISIDHVCDKIFIQLLICDFRRPLCPDMSADESDHSIAVTLKIPIVKSEGVQTSARIISKSSKIKDQCEMEAELEVQSASTRKRRNLSKNRGQATRQREKTPEPSRVAVPHEDTTSDDEDVHPNRTSREIEADNTYEEMRRLVQEQANIKDPVYDIDTDEILEARTTAANERRRRSISPFAIPDKEEVVTLERKGSFIDPGNKLLSTNYILNPKEDNPSRRDSLSNKNEVIGTRNSLSPPTSPKGKDQVQFFSAPKKLEENVYPDEIKKATDKIKSVQKKDEPINSEKEKKQITTKSHTPAPGELVTKIIQVERTPSKKLTQEQKPVIEVRERVVRTPSTKTGSDSKPVVAKQAPSKQINEQQSKVPPVKPARSKSSSRIVVSAYFKIFLILIFITLLVGLYYLFI